MPLNPNSETFNISALLYVFSPNHLKDNTVFYFFNITYYVFLLIFNYRYVYQPACASVRAFFDAFTLRNPQEPAY